jgi:predicted negative regulator of RcsB-dependent stress response
MLGTIVFGVVLVVGGFFAYDYYTYRKQAKKKKCCGGRCHTKKNQS